MATRSRHASPLFLPDLGPPVVLQSVVLGRDEAGGGRREKFVQQLVHDQPDLIPMANIEPAFSPLISICQELPTPAGYLDNLWMTPAGGIVLGECKLARSPQARREVIAQGLDYARALNTWGYEDLEIGVRRALGDKAASLWSMVAPDSSLTEAEFVDAVERRLRLGRFLVLIIGDGIQEGVEALASFLQLHAGLHTGLALVDLSIWEGVNGGLVVVPRVPMRTVVIERGVVTVDPTMGVKVVAPNASAQTSVAARVQDRAVSASEPEFYDQLELHRPGLPIQLRPLLTIFAEIGLTAEFRKSLVLRAPLAGGEMLTGALIDNYGGVWFGSAWGSANRLGQAHAGERYLMAMAELVSGQVKTYPTATPPEVLDARGKGVKLEQLIPLADRWAALVTEFIRAVAAGVQAQP